VVWSLLKIKNLKKYSIVCILPHFLYSSVSGHLVCFYILTVVHSAAVNMGM